MCFWMNEQASKWKNELTFGGKGDIGYWIHICLSKFCCYRTCWCERANLTANPPYVTVKLSTLQITGCFYLYDTYNYPVRPCMFVIQILISSLISVPLFSGWRTGIRFSMTQQNKPEICGHMDWLLHSQWDGLLSLPISLHLYCHYTSLSKRSFLTKTTKTAY